jgi:hypothetical protein
MLSPNFTKIGLLPVNTVGCDLNRSDGKTNPGSAVLGILREDWHRNSRLKRISVLKNVVLRDVTPCGSGKGRRFGGTYLHLPVD